MWLTVETAQQPSVKISKVAFKQSKKGKVIPLQARCGPEGG